jgi:hypothetical protein
MEKNNMSFLELLLRVVHYEADEKVAGEAYSRNLWRKKLPRVMDKLPVSEQEWEAHMAEARSLGLDPQWVQASLRAEFALLLRRVVADGVITGKEHIKVESARDLIGITEEEAAGMLHAIVAEAEQFFGKPIKGA